MHHVVTGVVVARGNVYFLAAHAVVARVGGLGRSGDIGQGAAGIGLGEGHGALPVAGVHQRRESRRELGRGEAAEQIGRAQREKGRHAGRIIGGLHGKRGRVVHSAGQLLAALSVGEEGVYPAIFAKALHDISHAGMHPDGAIH